MEKGISMIYKIEVSDQNSVQREQLVKRRAMMSTAT
jgi:hypothetical protein